MFHLAPAILVLAKRPRWEAELKRHTDDPSLRIRGCRTVDDALDLMIQIPGSLLIIDLEIGTADALRLTEAVDQRSLTCGILVIATSAELELEWPFRELGARDFLLDSLRGDDLARICRKQLATSCS